MPIESWTNPEDAPDLAAHARAMIDAALVGTALGRDAYWAAVRKGYNTPYNDPQPRPARAVGTVAVGTSAVAKTTTGGVSQIEMALPIAAMSALNAEPRAA